MPASKTHNGPFLFGLGLMDAKYFWSGCVASCGLRITSSRVSKPLKDRHGEITSSQLKGLVECVCAFVHRPSILTIFFGWIKVTHCSVQLRFYPIFPLFSSSWSYISLSKAAVMVLLPLFSTSHSWVRNCQVEFFFKPW